MLRRRIAPWLLGSFSLAGAALLFDCVGAEPPVPSATGGDAATDGTVDSASDTSSMEGGGGDADSSAGDSSVGTDADGGAIVDVVVHDGPQYSPPTELPVNPADSGGPGFLRTNPAVVAGGGDVWVTLDDYASTSGNLETYFESTNAGGSFGSTQQLPGVGSAMIVGQGYPTIARDAVNGNVYMIANGVAATMSQFNYLAFFVSTNGGTTFAPAINAASPSLATTDFVDNSSIAVDNGSGAGQGAVFMAYGRYGAAIDFLVTIDQAGAFSYATPVSPVSPDQASLPWVAVGPNHYVYVVYYGATAGMPFVGFVKSTNQGGAFSAPSQIAPLHMPFVAGVYNGNLGLEGVNTTDGGPTPVGLYASTQIATNPITGALYVTYADATLGADKANIYLIHSEDTGATWSTPIQVNDDTTTNDQFLPSLAVSPDGKRLAVDFHDRRNDPKNLDADRYGAIAGISGGTVTFEANFRITPKSFPVLTFTGGSTGYFGIHSGMSADATHFFDVFTTSANGNLNVEFARYGVLY